MTMLDRWAPWYRDPSSVGAVYGPPETYHIAENFLASLHVEDWGCGYGHFRQMHCGGYLGIDGTPGFCDLVADLTEYRSTTQAILIRGVLDHNLEWSKILDNALASFTVRMVLILFTPDGHGEQIGYVPVLDVCDYALPHGEITRRILDAGCAYDKTFHPNDSGYDGETVWCIRR